MAKMIFVYDGCVDHDNVRNRICNHELLNTTTILTLPQKTQTAMVQPNAELFLCAQFLAQTAQSMIMQLATHNKTSVAINLQ